MKRLKAAPFPSMTTLHTCLVLLLSASPVLAIPPSLSIETLNVRQQGTISFTVFVAGVTVPPTAMDLVSAETDDHKFNVGVDLNSIRPGRFGTFTAEIYVQASASLNSPAYKFVITGSPIGPFLDVDDRITVHVQEKAHDSKGYLNIPLHSGGQVDLLSADPVSQPMEVKLGQNKAFDLPIKNKLENIKLVVSSMDVDYSCAKCWKPASEPFKAVVVDENGTASLAINLIPNTLSALGASAFALKSDQPHDTLVVHVAYYAAYGGQERKQRFAVPVRFAPSIWALIAAVLIGAALGFLANIVLDQNARGSSKAVLSTAARSLVLVTIVEVVAFAMASYGTKVVIFTFDLDPRQFLPAVVIGVLVSGGASVVTYLKQVFGKP